MGNLTYLASLLALFLTLVLAFLYAVGGGVPGLEVLLYAAIPVSLMAVLSTGKLNPSYADLVGGCPDWAIVGFFALMLVDFLLLAGHGGSLSFSEALKPRNLPVGYALTASQYYACACVGYSNRVMGW